MISALLLSMVAIGFVYILHVAKIFHLAHGGLYSAGGLTCWWALTKTESWPIAILMTLCVLTVLAVVVEKIVYWPLHKRRSHQNISLIASTGLYIIIINLLALLFGNVSRIPAASTEAIITRHQIEFTAVQFVQATVGIISISLMASYLQYSKSSIVLRAISDNELVSTVYAVNIRKERLKVFIIGTILAGVAGTLRMLDVGIDPQAGMSITLTAAVVAILVGRLDIWTILLFSVLLALLQNTIEWFLNAQWRDGLTFLLLLLVILFRTDGILSYNLRKDSQ